MKIHPAAGLIPKDRFSDIFVPFFKILFPVKKNQSTNRIYKNYMPIEKKELCEKWNLQRIALMNNLN